MDKTKIHKMWIADQGDGTYSNPILYTDYSDPRVLPPPGVFPALGCG